MNQDTRSSTPPGGERRTSGSVTVLLQKMREGDDAALDAVFEAVYDELRRLAHLHMRRERTDHPLQTTALVHEAYFRLVDHHAVDWVSRTHFLGVAGRAMRQVLVEHARRHGTEKRGGNRTKVPHSPNGPAVNTAAETILAIHQALDRLAEISERMAQVVESRFFAGLTVTETARVLDVSESTVKRDWRTARAWMSDALQQ